MKIEKTLVVVMCVVDAVVFLQNYEDIINS